MQTTMIYQALLSLPTYDKSHVMSCQDCHPDKALAVSSVFETLSNSTRREVINYFEDTANRQTVQIGELATHISNRSSSKNSNQLELELHHLHLPKLEEKNWLEYDNRQGDIRYHGKESAEHLIEEVHEIF